MQPHLGNPPPTQMANFGSFNPMAGFNNLPGGNVLAAAAGVVADPNKKPPPPPQLNKHVPDNNAANNEQQNEQKGELVQNNLISSRVLSINGTAIM